MNDDRRKELMKAKKLLLEAQDIIDNVYSLEEEVYDNLPDSFKSGRKGESIERACDDLDMARSNIEEAVDAIDSL